MIPDTPREAAEKAVEYDEEGGGLSVFGVAVPLPSMQHWHGLPAVLADLRRGVEEFVRKRDAETARLTERRLACEYGRAVP